MSRRIKFEVGDRVLLRTPYIGSEYVNPEFRLVVRALTRTNIELYLLGERSVCGKAIWPHEAKTWVVGRTKGERLRTWRRYHPDPLRHEPTMTLEAAEAVLRAEGATEIQALRDNIVRIACRPSRARPGEQATATISWVDGDQFRIAGWTS